MASPIEDYAMIGDGRTAALVSRYGSIDWLCLPRFDSDACCAALLGSEDNGFWQIAPCADSAIVRRYRPDTLILETDFATASGAVRLTDCMPTTPGHPVVIRHVAGLRGTTRIRTELALRFDFGLLPPRIIQRDGALIAIVGPDLVILHSSVALRPTNRQTMAAEFDIAVGQVASFVLSYGSSHRPPPPPIDAVQALADTEKFWHDWAGQFRRDTKYRDAIMRSLLTLKALIHEPTGAMVAAATTSLPEASGGTLNWDYRYCWLRDASFTITALLNAGYRGEAMRWRDWLLRTIGCAPDKMRIMYRVDGGRHIHERQVPWLGGYNGAIPVRVGNDAATQRQTDVVGELLDALDLMTRGGVEPTSEALDVECELVTHLERVWRDGGHGLWENRDEPERYTYGRVMSWVGVDRFLRGAAARTCDAAMIGRLRGLRRQIRADILAHAWNSTRGHFVHRFGGDQLDASLLLLPLVGFLPADDPRMSATIDAIECQLGEGGLIWRGARDNDAGAAAFIPCSCWFADCRALQGRRDEATTLLRRVLSLRNDVGLLSEMYHPGERRLLGNFPQALSHLAMVNTALGLSGPVLQRGGG